MEGIVAGDNCHRFLSSFLRKCKNEPLYFQILADTQKLVNRKHSAAEFANSLENLGKQLPNRDDIISMINSGVEDLRLSLYQGRKSIEGIVPPSPKKASNTRTSPGPKDICSISKTQSTPQTLSVLEANSERNKHHLAECAERKSSTAVTKSQLLPNTSQIQQNHQHLSSPSQIRSQSQHQSNSSQIQPKPQHLLRNSQCQQRPQHLQQNYTKPHDLTITSQIQPMHKETKITSSTSKPSPPSTNSSTVPIKESSEGRAAGNQPIKHSEESITLSLKRPLQGKYPEVPCQTIGDTKKPKTSINTPKNYNNSYPTTTSQEALKYVQGSPQRLPQEKLSAKDNEDNAVMFKVPSTSNSRPAEGNVSASREVSNIRDNQKIPPELCDSKDEHRAWFIGIKDKNITSKSQFMKNKAKNRLRNWMTLFREDVMKSITHNPRLKKPLEKLLKDLQKNLLKDKSYEDYFDRQVNAPLFCDKQGLFICKGPEGNGCREEEKHSINPYFSRKERDNFRMWEFDHVIPRKHILEEAIEKSKNPPKRLKLSWEKYFKHLFGSLNLRLVHKSCHDTSERPMIDLPGPDYMQDSQCSIFSQPLTPPAVYSNKPSSRPLTSPAVTGCVSSSSTIQTDSFHTNSEQKQPVNVDVLGEISSLHSKVDSVITTLNRLARHLGINSTAQ